MLKQVIIVILSTLLIGTLGERVAARPSCLVRGISLWSTMSQISKVFGPCNDADLNAGCLFKFSRTGIWIEVKLIPRPKLHQRQLCLMATNSIQIGKSDQSAPISLRAGITTDQVKGKLGSPNSTKSRFAGGSCLVYLFGSEELDIWCSSGEKVVAFSVLAQGSKSHHDY